MKTLLSQNSISSSLSEHFLSTLYCAITSSSIFPEKSERRRGRLANTSLSPYIELPPQLRFDFGVILWISVFDLLLCEPFASFSSFTLTCCCSRHFLLSNHQFIEIGIVVTAFSDYIIEFICIEVGQARSSTHPLFPHSSSSPQLSKSFLPTSPARDFFSFPSNQQQ